MPSKTSWINKEVIILSLRNAGWVGIVYFIALLFSLPVAILGRLSNEDPSYPITIEHNLFMIQYPIQVGLMLFIPVILSLFLFRYLHVKQAGDFIHSLPLHRRKLFFHFTGTGLGLLIIPILLNTIILLSLYTLTDLHEFIGIGDIFIWCGTTILVNLLLFTASTFVAMITGLTAVQGALTYILLLLPAGMFVLICYSLKNFLYGFPEDYYFSVQMEEYSPLIKAAYLEDNLLSGTDVLMFIVITLVFYGLSYFLYQSRKVEVASQAIVHPILRPLFKYGISFCFMLFGGMYFNGVYQSVAWTLFGYFFGSLIGYYIGQMILEKHWRVFRHWKGYAGFAICMVLVGIGIRFDLFNYEKKVPDMADVETVHVSDTFYSLTDNPENLIEDPFIKDQKTIQAVLDLHKEILDNQDHDTQSDRKSQIFLYYKLKNGHKLVRNYWVNTEDIESEYATLYKMKNYKEVTEQIYGVDSNKVDKITIYNEISNNSGITISDPAEIREAIDILKEGTYQESFEDRRKVKLYNVELLLPDGMYAHADVKHTDKKFLSWLKDKGYVDDTNVKTSSIESMYVTAQADFIDRLPQSPEQTVSDLKEEDIGFEIKDTEQIESLMTRLVYDYEESDYAVIIRHKNEGNVQAYGLQKKDAPSFIKEKFDE
ncbi:DUF6449 domain-containing protein [Rossellomorea aquimaris]|uniref:DUF6449 domain-containing protein n=1 Tax=Rossellomorea aquimaris TaxID=189382 RepID=UPI001CD29672|nr:DUF6449 domain-containing protein [Rossellomorea aquimaris]MCA1059842.1 DUF6449 domain-containing protein [Rossellomorea aquimaris]